MVNESTEGQPVSPGRREVLNLHILQTETEVKGSEGYTQRAAYWHGMLPSLLGGKGSEIPRRLCPADLAWASLEQLIRTPPPPSYS